MTFCYNAAWNDFYVHCCWSIVESLFKFLKDVFHVSVLIIWQREYNDEVIWGSLASWYDHCVLLNDFSWEFLTELLWVALAKMCQTASSEIGLVIESQQCMQRLECNMTYSVHCCRIIDSPRNSYNSLFSDILSSAAMILTKHLDWFEFIFRFWFRFKGTLTILDKKWFVTYRLSGFRALSPFPF